jgi:hypothetical protein
VIQPFVVPNISMEPEITKGSRILVWKLTSTFAPGDIVAYRHGDRIWVARVKQAGPTGLTLQLNKSPSTEVQPDVVVGKVISVLWRPSPASAETYTGQSIVRPIRSQLGAEASAAEALASKIATPREISKIPAIVSGRLLDQDGKPLGGKSLAFVKEGSVVIITDGPTGDDGTFQFELPVDQPWQVILLGRRAYGKLAPRSEAMITPTPGSSTSDVPNYDLALRLDGTRLQSRLTPLSLEAMHGTETNTPQSIVASRLQLAALLKEHADLREAHGAKHPEVLELFKRIEDLRTIIKQGGSPTAPATPSASPPMPKDGAGAMWGEAQDGLQAGICFNGEERMGGEVKVELWVQNSGTATRSPTP